MLLVVLVLPVRSADSAGAAHSAGGSGGWLLVLLRLLALLIVCCAADATCAAGTTGYYRSIGPAAGTNGPVLGCEAHGQERWAEGMSNRTQWLPIARLMLAPS